MIVNKNINPSRDLYNLGAIVVDTLNTYKSESFEMLDVFNKVNQREKISLQLFLLVLDWLFLLGAIKRSNSGTLEKCF